MKASKKIKFLYNKGNYKELDLYFKSINWVLEFEGCDVDVCYEKWLKIYESGCEKFIPKLKIDNNNSRNNKFSPWMTKELKGLCREKKNSWFKNRNSGFKNNLELNNYKKLNKVIKKLVKRNIRDNERNLAANSKHNPKSVYSYINNKTNIKDSIKAIKMNNGNTSTDSLEIAETLNEFFASVFIKDDSTVVDLNSECVTKCSDPIFNVCIVQKHLSNLNIQKSTGPDKVHPKNVQNR